MTEFKQPEIAKRHMEGIQKYNSPVTMTVRRWASLRVFITLALSAFTRFFITSKPRKCMSLSTAPLWRNILLHQYYFIRAHSIKTWLHFNVIHAAFIVNHCWMYGHFQFVHLHFSGFDFENQINKVWVSRGGGSKIWCTCKGTHWGLFYILGVHI